MSLIWSLETVLTVKAKEDLANAMISILHKQGRSAQFLTDIVVNEVQELDNDTMAFRGNSLATKAMECFLKLVGEKVSRPLLIAGEKVLCFSCPLLSLCALWPGGDSAEHKGERNRARGPQPDTASVLPRHAAMPRSSRPTWPAGRCVCMQTDRQTDSLW